MVIYKEVKELQKSAAQNDYIDAYFGRTFSAPLSVLFITLGLSANFVTVLSLITDLVAIYLMSISQWFFAGIFVLGSYILDNSDGEVARHNIKKGKKAKGKSYGAYLDEILGTIGFTLVIVFAGHYMENIGIGIFAMFSLFMLIITAQTAQVEFPQKREIAKKFERSIFGNLKGRIGFSNGAQRILIALAVVFASPVILLIFAILASLLIIIKFWLYRNL